MNVSACIEVMQVQTVRYVKCGRCCEHASNMFLDSAGEEKAEEKLVVSKCLSNDANEFGDHLSIVTLIKSIDNDDRGSARLCQGLHRFNDQFLELRFKRPIVNITILLQGVLDVWPRGWDRERKIVRKC